jgi:hypothetical protein
MITLDTSAFDAALKRKLAFTQKDVKEVLNTEAKYVVIQAALRTKQASEQAIEKSLFTGTITRSTNKRTGRLLKKPKLVAYRPTKAV